MVSYYEILEKNKVEKEEKKEMSEEEEEDEEEEEESGPGSTLFIKNLNFSTTEDRLQEVCHFVKTTLS